MKWLGVVGLLVFVPNVQAALMYSEGFETGAVKVRETATCSNKDRNLVPQTQFVRSGKYSMLMKKDANENVRCEIIPGRSYPRSGDFMWGKEYWAGFSFLIPANEKNTGWGIFHQHHSAMAQTGYCEHTGGNGFTLIRSKDGKSFDIRLTPSWALNKKSGPSAGANTDLAYSFPFETNKWFDVVMNFKYSDKSDGFWKIWVNGKQVVNRTGSNVNIWTSCGTLKKRWYAQLYGTYVGIKSAGAIIYDEVKNGDANSSYAEVSPGGRSATSGSIPVTNTPPKTPPRSLNQPKEPTIPQSINIEIN